MALILSVNALTSYSSPTANASVPALSENIIRNNPILTLQVTTIFPQNGMILTNFPASLKVQVTRGGYPEQGATVQFWMQGGSRDAAMHNAFLTMTDSSGFAYLTLLNQNTLDPGYYNWHAGAIKAGFKGGSTSGSYFIIPSDHNKNFPSGGTVSTDQKKYYIGLGNNVDVKISGNVNGYGLGSPIILKIISPSKITKLVAYGTYLGAFQITYKLGNNSEVGAYKVTAFYKYGEFSTDFNVVKSNS